MFKVSQLVALGAGAAVITLGLAAAEARDGRQARTPEPVVQAVSAPAATPEEKAELGQAAAEKIVQIPACARKVKVVYSGYGEGDRAACPSPAN